MPFCRFLPFPLNPATEPSGTVVLTFSANCTIRLEVEYLDLQLKDLGRGVGYANSDSPASLVTSAL